LSYCLSRNVEFGPDLLPLSVGMVLFHASESGGFRGTPLMTPLIFFFSSSSFSAVGIFHQGFHVHKDVTVYSFFLLPPPPPPPGLFSKFSSQESFPSVPPSLLRFFVPEVWGIVSESHLSRNYLFLMLRSIIFRLPLELLSSLISSPSTFWRAGVGVNCGSSFRLKSNQQTKGFHLFTPHGKTF